MDGYGRIALNYVKDNAASLASGVVVTVGASAIAAAGTKAVTTTCLIGGGLFATFVAHEAAKRIFNISGEVVKKISSSFKEEPKPNVTRVDNGQGNIITGTR